MSLCIRQRLNIQHERNKLRADKEELEIMQEDLAQERRQIHAQQQQLSTERKAFHDTKYNFLLDNAILPEWREEEIRKLLMFDFLIDANKQLNILYANKK